MAQSQSSPEDEGGGFLGEETGGEKETLGGDSRGINLGIV